MRDDLESPQEGEVWIRRKTGEEFEIWSVGPYVINLNPMRPGNRRNFDVKPNNFFQEYVPAMDGDRRKQAH